jgi:hypothetical protein
VQGWPRKTLARKANYAGRDTHLLAPSLACSISDLDSLKILIVINNQSALISALPLGSIGDKPLPNNYDTADLRLFLMFLPRWRDFTVLSCVHQT